MYSRNVTGNIADSCSINFSVCDDRQQIVRQTSSPDTGFEGRVGYYSGCGQFRNSIEDTSNCTGKSLYLSEVKTFCHEATIVGLKNIVRPSATKIRPIIWSLLILGGIIGTVYLCEERIQLYLTWPTTVDVRVEFVDSMRFPMTTICNENKIRRRYVENIPGKFNIIIFSSVMLEKLIGNLFFYLLLYDLVEVTDKKEINLNLKFYRRTFRVVPTCAFQVSM